MTSLLVAVFLFCGGIALGSLPGDPTLKTPKITDGVPELSIWEYPGYPPEALKPRIEGKVVVRAVISAEGDVTSAGVVSTVDPRLDATAVETVEGWKFTPGLEYGVPAAYCMEVPVLFSRAMAHKRPKIGLPPPGGLRPWRSPRTGVVEKTAPGADYPEILAGRKFAGAVSFTCIINAEGRAVSPRVTGATHVDFILPALETLAQWEYIPAMQGDLPVKATIENKLTFQALTNRRQDILAANGLTAPDGGEPPFAPEPYLVADAVWPYAPLMAGQGGAAAAEFTVLANGAVAGVKLREATAPEFGRALVAALQTWGFNSARENGRPVNVPLLLRVKFKAVPAGSESAADPVERLIAALRAGEIGPAKELDEPLVSIYRPPPAYPVGLAEGARLAGSAQIEFVIDRDGRARLPRILSATREEFGWAAATAVAQWVYRVPHRGGQPVDVLVQIPIEFAMPRK